MKKKRIDSHSGEGELFRSKKPEPPQHLRECDIPFWDKVVSARDFTSWTDYDLEQAANLAQTLCKIRELRSEINTEGDVIGGKENPKYRLLDTLTKSSLALARSIQVFAGATVGQAKDMKKRNKAQKEILEDRKNYDSDSLIPGLVQ